MEKGDLLKVVDEVYEKIFCPQPLPLEWLKATFRPLIDKRVLQAIVKTQLELAEVYRQVIPHMSLYLDTNFVLRVLTRNDVFFCLHENFLRILNSLEIPIRLFRHVQEEVIYALDVTIGKQISITPKKVKAFKNEVKVSPFAVEYFCDFSNRSISSYLYTLRRRFSCLIRKSKIEVVETPNVTKEELAHLEECFRNNFSKTKMVAYTDALSILSIRELNKKAGMIIVKTEDARIPIYNLITLASLDSTLTQNFPYETAIPLEVIFRLDEPYAILTEKAPLYQEMEKEYYLAKKRKDSLEHSILCRLSEMLVRNVPFTTEHVEALE